MRQSNDQMAQLQAQAAASEASAKDLSEKLQAAESNSTALQQLLQSTQAELEQKVGRASELDEAVLRHEQEAAAMKDQLEQQAASINQQGATIASLDADLADTRKELAELHSQVNVKNQSIEVLQSQTQAQVRMPSFETCTCTACVSAAALLHSSGCSRFV